MFDKKYINVSAKSPETIIMHEHRAPTDASVHLLMEMESAAREKINQVGHLKSTDFECIIQFFNDFPTAQRYGYIIFNLNNKKHTLKIDIPDEVMMSAKAQDYQEMIKFIKQHVCEYLTNLILPDIMLASFSLNKRTTDL